MRRHWDDRPEVVTTLDRDRTPSPHLPLFEGPIPRCQTHATNPPVYSATQIAGMPAHAWLARCLVGRCSGAVLLATTGTGTAGSPKTTTPAGTSDAVRFYRLVPKPQVSRVYRPARARIDRLAPASTGSRPHRGGQRASNRRRRVNVGSTPSYSRGAPAKTSVTP